MGRLIIIISFFSLFFSFGCKTKKATTNSSLTEQERHLCDSLKIDTTIALGVRAKTDSAFTVFPLDLSTVLNLDMDTLTGKQINGLILNAANENADNIVTNLYSDFQKKGYTIFFLNRNFGIGNKPDILAILKTTDKYQILKQVQTNGINWEIDNDSLLNLVKIFDNKYSLDLVGASGDWCEFKINKDPQNWLTFAKEAYKVCPDIVDQGSGTVEKLAEEMKKTKRLYFWWD